MFYEIHLNLFLFIYFFICFFQYIICTINYFSICSYSIFYILIEEYENQLVIYAREANCLGNSIIYGSIDVLVFTTMLAL